MTKNAILVGSLLLVVTCSYGQWTNTTNPTTTGKVGIGTTAPNFALSFGGTSLNTTKIALYDDGNPVNAYGIGIAGGQLRFHVGGTAPLNTSYTNTNKITFLNGPDGNELVNIYGIGGAKINLLASTSTFLLNNAAGNSLFKVNSYGAVVINIRGSENPYSTSFDIKSNHTVPPSFAMASEVTGYGSATLRIGIAQNSNNACGGCFSDKSLTSDVVISSLSSNSTATSTITGASLLLTNHSYMGSIKFTTKDSPTTLYSGDKQRMEIKYDGKVVIGMPEDFTAATTPYPNGYNLFVSKGILTEKLKIGNPTIDWSDFVFADGYKMRSLTEVEKYIKQFKHLPEIPSTDDVRTNGIDVAKMDALLLQKIEELTLYLIKIEKENERISRELELLRTTK